MPADPLLVEHLESAMPSFRWCGRYCRRTTALSISADTHMHCGRRCATKQHKGPACILMYVILCSTLDLEGLEEVHRYVRVDFVTAGLCRKSSVHSWSTSESFDIRMIALLEIVPIKSAVPHDRLHLARHRNVSDGKAITRNGSGKADGSDIGMEQRQE